MPVCTYDNPATMARECWQDGELICKYNADLFFLKDWPVPPQQFFFGANTGDWEAGKLVGDEEAMTKEISRQEGLFKCSISCSCGSTEDIRVIQYRDGWGKSAKGYHSEKHAVCRSCRQENHDTWRYVI